MRTWKEKYWYIGKSPTDFVLVKLVGLTFLIKYQCFFVRSSIAQIFASFRKPKIIRFAFRPSQLLSIGRSLWKDPICWWSWAHLGEVFFFSFYLSNYVISSWWFCLLTYKSKTIFFLLGLFCFLPVFLTSWDALQALCVQLQRHIGSFQRLVPISTAD